MKKIHSDIFVFEKSIPDELINLLMVVRNSQGHENRIDIHRVNLDVFYKFNNFWKNEIENKVIDDYLSIYDVSKNIGYNVSVGVIDGIKNYVKTKWRDLFLLHYTTSNSLDIARHVHWDFGNFTVVGCLNDGFDGGELCFPRQNVGYTLTMGDVIVFPGGLSHPHFLTPVTGVRNVIVGQTLTLTQDHRINYD